MNNTGQPQQHNRANGIIINYANFVNGLHWVFPKIMNTTKDG
jgi:hypothetical protein